MVKAKICGITKIEDAILAAELGAWAIGFIFYPQSPRYITPENAYKIAQKMKKFGTKTIGVFVNETGKTVNQIATIADLDYVQLHGKEPIDECNKIRLPFIKNIRNTDEINDYNQAFAFLVDAPDTNNWGGTGNLADWNLAQNIKAQKKTLILSGGLSPDNIEKALLEVNPDYVDISSSLENAPGEKKHSKMIDFFEKLKNSNGDKN